MCAHVKDRSVVSLAYGVGTSSTLLSSCGIPFPSTVYESSYFPLTISSLMMTFGIVKSNFCESDGFETIPNYFNFYFLDY